MTKPETNSNYFFGVCTISVCGILARYAYNWSGCSEWAELFFAVNASIWERVKSMLWPTGAWWMGHYLLYGEERWAQRAATAMTVSTMSLLTLHLLDMQLFGFFCVGYDMSIFVLSIAAGHWGAVHDYHVFSARMSVFVRDCFIIALAGFTGNPPHVPILFYDPRVDMSGPVCG